MSKIKFNDYPGSTPETRRRIENANNMIEEKGNSTSIKSRFNSVCRCGCRKPIRAGDPIAYTYDRFDRKTPWFRAICIQRIEQIEQIKDPYVRHRCHITRIGIEKRLTVEEYGQAVMNSEPYECNWLEDDLLCEDVYTSTSFCKGE